MTFSQRNRLSTAGATSIPQLEARVMLMGDQGDQDQKPPKIDGTPVRGSNPKPLTRQEIEPGFETDEREPEDGFARTRNVNGTRVAAIENAWNREAIDSKGGRLGSATSNSGNRARVTVTESPNEGTTTDAPFGFPALLVGKSNGVASADNPLGNDGIPQDEIGSIPFNFVSNGGGNGGPDDQVYNNTLDIWFGQERIDGGTDEARDVPRGLVMLQNYNSHIATTTDGSEGPGQPAGSLVESGVSFDGIGGVYDVWFGENAGTEAEGGVPVNVTSYIRRDQETGGRQSTSGDLNVLIQDAQGRGNLDADLPLNAVFAGSEVWNGGEGLFNELELDVVEA